MTRPRAASERNPGRVALVRMYRTERKSMRQVAAAVGVSTTTLRAWMRSFRIRRRSISVAKRGTPPARQAIEASVFVRRRHFVAGLPEVGYRVDGDGYVHVLDQATGMYRRQHRVVLEKKVGRPLRAGEIAHHENRVRDDNREGNISGYASAAEHQREHSKTRGRLSNGTFAPDGAGVAKVGTAKCSVDVCDRPSRRRGLCNGHWFWSRNHGWEHPKHAIGDGKKFPRPGRRKKAA